MPPPQEAELRAYFHAHPDKFRTEPLISFRQVFVSTSRGGAAEADARQIARAAGQRPAPGAADERRHPAAGRGVQPDAARAGSPRCSATTSRGRWRGPHRGAGSARCGRPTGLHLVLVTAVEPAALPPFEQVRRGGGARVVRRASRRGAGGPVSSPARRLSGDRARSAGGGAMMRLDPPAGSARGAAAAGARRLRAHEVRPGFLELRETAANAFLMTWKVPALGEYPARHYATPARNLPRHRPSRPRCRPAAPSSSTGG